MSNPLSDISYGLKYNKTQNLVLKQNDIEIPYILSAFDSDLKYMEFIIDNKMLNSIYELYTPVFENDAEVYNNTIVIYYYMPQSLTKYVNYLLYSFKSINLFDSILDYSGLKNNITQLNLKSNAYNFDYNGFSYYNNTIEDGLLIFNIMRNANLNYLNMITTYNNFINTNTFIPISLQSKVLNLLNSNSYEYDIINLGITNLLHSSYIGYQLSSSQNTIQMFTGNLQYGNPLDNYLYTNLNFYNVISNASFINNSSYVINTTSQSSFLFNSFANSYYTLSNAISYSSSLYQYPIIGIGGIVEQNMISPNNSYFNIQNLQISQKADVFTYNNISLLNFPNINYVDTINNITYNFQLLNSNPDYLLEETANKYVLRYNTMYSNYSIASSITKQVSSMNSIKTNVTFEQISNISDYLKLLNSGTFSNLYSFKTILSQSIPTGINF